MSNQFFCLQFFCFVVLLCEWCWLIWLESHTNPVLLIQTLVNVFISVCCVQLYWLLHLMGKRVCVYNVRSRITKWHHPMRRNRRVWIFWDQAENKRNHAAKLICLKRSFLNDCKSCLACVKLVYNFDEDKLSKDFFTGLSQCWHKSCMENFYIQTEVAKTSHLLLKLKCILNGFWSITYDNYAHFRSSIASQKKIIIFLFSLSLRGRAFKQRGQNIIFTCLY